MHNILCLDICYEIKAWDNVQCHIVEQGHTFIVYCTWNIVWRTYLNGSLLFNNDTPLSLICSLFAWFAYIKSLSFHCNKYTIWNTFSTENNYEITWWKVKHEVITGSMFILKLKFHMEISDQPILFLFCKITVTIQVLTVQLEKRNRNVSIQILLP